MEHIDFTQLLILVLIGLLFFKEQLLTFLPGLLGIKKPPEVRAVEETAPLWAENLMAYFNHDTTEHHQATLSKIDSTLNKLDGLTEIGRENNQLLKNIDRYGVKCRKDP